MTKTKSVGIPLGQWSGSDATRELQETIKQFNAKADQQTRHLILLTKAIVGLTVAMIVLVGVQIYVAVTSLPG